MRTSVHGRWSGYPTTTESPRQKPLGAGPAAHSRRTASIMAKFPATPDRPTPSRPNQLRHRRRPPSRPRRRAGTARTTGCRTARRGGTPGTPPNPPVAAGDAVSVTPSVTLTAGRAPVRAAGGPSRLPHRPQPAAAGPRRRSSGLPQPASGWAWGPRPSPPPQPTSTAPGSRQRSRYGLVVCCVATTSSRRRRGVNTFRQWPRAGPSPRG